MLHVSKTTCHVGVCLQRAPPWMRSWPPSNGAASTWGRLNCVSWPPTRTTTPTTSWLRSGRVSGWRRYGHDRSSSSVTPRAFFTLPTPWPAASTRLWGGLKRPRRSRSLRTKAFHALTGRASFVFRLDLEILWCNWNQNHDLLFISQVKLYRRMFFSPDFFLLREWNSYCCCGEDTTSNLSSCQSRTVACCDGFVEDVFSLCRKSVFTAFSRLYCIHLVHKHEWQDGSLFSLTVVQFFNALIYSFWSTAQVVLNI